MSPLQGINSQVIKREFEGFKSRMGKPSQELMRGAEGHRVQITPFAGGFRTVYADAQQYTTHLVPAGEDGQARYWTVESKPGGAYKAFLKVATFYTSGQSRSLDVEIEEEAGRLTRNVRFTAGDKWRTETVVVNGNSATTQEKANGLDDPIAELLDPKERAILQEWNLTSLL